eukprot:1642800-Rhodomonas_salina.1
MNIQTRAVIDTGRGSALGTRRTYPKPSLHAGVSSSSLWARLRTGLSLAWIQERLLAAPTSRHWHSQRALVAITPVQCLGSTAQSRAQRRLVTTPSKTPPLVDLEPSRCVPAPRALGCRGMSSLNPGPSLLEDPRCEEQVRELRCRSYRALRGHALPARAER